MDDAKDKHATIFKKNDAILGKFYDELKESVDKENKVKINDCKSPSFYLPPISEVSSVFGFITNQKQFIDIFEAQYKKPLKISRTSKYALFNKGVGLRTTMKIIKWLKLLPVPFENLLPKKVIAKSIRAAQAKSNAIYWFPAIHSFKEGCKHSGHDDLDEFSPLLNFIEQRCNTEVNLMLEFKKDLKVGKIKLKDNISATKFQQSLWANCPNISPSTILKLSELIEFNEQQKQLTEQQKLTFIESYCSLIFDFYLEAITHYEIGCRMYYETNKEKAENELGMVTKAINAYARQENIKTCFAGLLKEFKSVLSETNENEGYRKLASCIEIDESEPSEFGESLRDKQYNQLKDWRNGQNLPSGEKLTVFIQNLDKYANTSRGLVTFFMCKTVIAMDKLIDEFIEQSQNDNCNQADAEIIIKKVLSKVPNYYQTNLKKELEKTEPATW
ncbi:hypothetical protein [Colwellia sp. 20A7]|uniref:hypothetical protein n=1 Tax=Colwellia sp. 20A7 TaxID=2689569 RepID=UPI001358AE43|nr:hypothetical protein [Colwellia sp. 20A7]